MAGELMRLEYRTPWGWAPVRDCPPMTRAALEREQKAREAFNQSARVSRSYRIAPAVDGPRGA